jgi:hypothetical protein
MFHRKEKISRRIYMEERIIKDINNLLTQLFRKMKEAGYEWDAEKKEMKKIKQNPAWSEEDEDMIQALNACINAAIKGGMNYISFDSKSILIGKVKNWLKSIKGRVQPNQEWSEEDEEMYKEVLTDIIYAKNDLKTKGCLGLSKKAMKAFNWFSKRHKSLRPQSKWKPSEKQMIALKNAIVGKRGPLYELYFDLEKL